MKTPDPKKLSADQRQELLTTLKARFEKNPQRHAGLSWADVETKLKNATASQWWSLAEMERTGGEPDVVVHDRKSAKLTFIDCSPQSPAGRWSLCYDRAALEARKEHRPKTSALDMASEMGVELLDEPAYLSLQTLGEFDTKSSSWVKTPADIRKLGGAIFGDRRFGRVFIYHNGAQSYYSGRGFRALLTL